MAFQAKPLPPPSALSLCRYFFAVLAILTVLGMLNGLVLLPVLLSLMGPPPEAVYEDAPAAGHLPSCPPEPLPLPPPMAHHGYDYAGGRRAQQQAFSESEDSEYYSETTATGTSGIGSEGDYGYCDRSAYSAPHGNPANGTSHILLEASRNPSFPKLTVRSDQPQNSRTSVLHVYAGQ